MRNNRHPPAASAGSALATLADSADQWPPLPLVLMPLVLMPLVLMPAWKRIGSGESPRRCWTDG